MPKITSKNRAEDIRIVHAILGELLERVEQQIHNPEAHSAEETHFWWGKDSVLSVLTKITQILSKTIPLEGILEVPENNPKRISKEDAAILQRYVQACIKAGKGE